MGTNSSEEIMKLANKKADGIILSIKNTTVDFVEKTRVDLGLVYDTYLKAGKEKYSKIRTIISGDIDRELYSFYQYIDLKNDDKLISTKSVKNIFNISGKVIITGRGGSGKSTMMKHFFISSIDDCELVPVLIELRHFNDEDLDDKSIYNNIYNKFKNERVDFKDNIFEYSLQRGDYVIIFDGLDEVASDKYTKMSRLIRDFSSRYINNYYIITSRPESFKEWVGFSMLEYQKLTKKQAIDFIERTPFEKSTRDKFIDDLKNNLFEKYKSFASNPLLLEIMLLTYKVNSVIPNKVNEFYEQAFNVLYMQHDSFKDAYVREKKSRLSCEQAKLVFGHFCLKSYLEENYYFNDRKIEEYLLYAREKSNLEFDINDFKNDLIKCVCMLIREGDNYKFVHRSFQEYFAAVRMCKKPQEMMKTVLEKQIIETLSTNVFIDTVCDIESEKVNEFVFYPCLKEEYEAYLKLGKTLEFIREYICDRVEIGKAGIGWIFPSKGIIQRRNCYRERIFLANGFEGKEYTRNKDYDIYRQKWLQKFGDKEVNPITLKGTEFEEIIIENFEYRFYEIEVVGQWLKRYDIKKNMDSYEDIVRNI